MSWRSKQHGAGKHTGTHALRTGQPAPGPERGPVVLSAETSLQRWSQLPAALGGPASNRSLVTVVRSPVAHVVSAYYHCKEAPTHKAHRHEMPATLLQWLLLFEQPSTPKPPIHCYGTSPCMHPGSRTGVGFTWQAARRGGAPRVSRGARLVSWHTSASSNTPTAHGPLCTFSRPRRATPAPAMEALACKRAPHARMHACAVRGAASCLPTHK